MKNYLFVVFICKKLILFHFEVIRNNYHYRWNYSLGHRVLLYRHIYVVYLTKDPYKLLLSYSSFKFMCLTVFFS